MTVRDHCLAVGLGLAGLLASGAAADEPAAPYFPDLGRYHRAITTRSRDA